MPAETGPLRTCIVTREAHPKAELIRFAVGPEGALVPDIRAKLPGRGAWITGSAATLQLAIKRKAFTRAFKRELVFPERLSDLVESLLEADALQALSIAKKAGLVTLGMAKIEAAIATKAVLGLVHAAEAGADGVRKLDSALYRRYGADAVTKPKVQIFKGDQLDLALGRTHVIHALLTSGAAGDGFFERTLRLERYRGSSSPPAVQQP